jgi:sulfate permease, SulP family
LPIIGWLRTYDRRWLRGDLVAGVTVAALIVPKNLGYAGIAGIPLQNGLYAAAAGALLYGIFGTSRQISMGPSSGLAAVAASAVLVAGVSGGDVATFVAGITLTSGILFFLLAVLRMGWVAQFLSRAVVTGFLFGAAIDVVIGELPKITGTDVEGTNSLHELWVWLGTLPERNTATVVVGVIALVVVFGLRALAPRVPGALVWWSAGCWRHGCSTSARTGSRSSATSHEVSPRSWFRPAHCCGAIGRSSPSPLSPWS